MNVRIHQQKGVFFDEESGNYRRSGGWIKIGS
jgi:hypothetical protein